MYLPPPCPCTCRPQPSLLLPPTTMYLTLACVGIFFKPGGVLLNEVCLSPYCVVQKKEWARCGGAWKQQGRRQLVNVEGDLICLRSLPLACMSGAENGVDHMEDTYVHSCCCPQRPTS